MDGSYLGSAARPGGQFVCVTAIVVHGGFLVQLMGSGFQGPAADGVGVCSASQAAFRPARVEDARANVVVTSESCIVSMILSCLAGVDWEFDRRSMREEDGR